MTDKTSNRLLIIDGSNLLFQMFFGMPARIVGKNGKPMQGTLGFVGALLKIIRIAKPTHLAVIFDGEHENSRCAVNPDYKANRTDYSEVGENENPFSQLPDIYNALNFLSVKHTEAMECEADDVIAAYALSCKQKTEIIISSFDSDFFQLISDTVSVLRYRGSKTVICTPEYVMNKLGITPCQYADFKSLTGDKADNIKGAEKVGIKTAALLLSKFGTLENIIANAENIEKTSVKESIIRNSERLKNNYKIIKLSNNASLPFNMEQLKYSYKEISTSMILKEIGLI